LEAFLPDLASIVERKHVEFLDKELIWIRRRFSKRKFVDLVAKVRLMGQSGFILIHVEHQSEKDPDIPRRMFLYAAWLIERYGLPVWPVLLTSYASPRKMEPDRFELSVRDKPILLFRYDVVQLNRLNWREYLNRPNPAAAALMVRMNFAPAHRVQVKSEILRMLLTLQLRPEKARLILGFVETYLELTAREELRIEREIAKFLRKDQETIMKMLLPGERAGLRKGRQEGRLEMLREGILDILEARFKQVPYPVRQSLADIKSEPRLRKLHRQAVLAQSIERFAEAI
jgi:hypothetical protein